MVAGISFSSNLYILADYLGILYLNIDGSVTSHRVISPQSSHLGLSITMHSATLTLTNH